MDLTLSKDIYHVSKQDQFKTLLYKLNMEYLRKEISEFLLRRRDEDEYFDVTGFHNKYGSESTTKLIADVMVELQALGWKCLSAYSGNGLYIYSTEKEPASVW